MSGGPGKLRSIVPLYLLAVLAFCWPLASFSMVSKDVQKTVMVDGVARSYLLHVPITAKNGAALVLVLHGGGGRSDTMSGITGMDSVADDNGFVVAYPQGLGLVWNDGGSDLTEGKQSRDDVAFLRSVVKDVAASDGIDGGKVFACGFSNGGSMCARLALENRDLIAGAAMVGSGLYKKHVQKFVNPRPIPILLIEGTDDPCYPYEGGLTHGPKMGGIYNGETHGEALSLKETVDFWRKVNGCSGQPEVGVIPHLTKDKTATTYQKWRGANGNDVVAMTVKGGGHCWPGGIQYFPVKVIGKTTYDFSASRAIWRFFAAHGGT